MLPLSAKQQTAERGGAGGRVRKFLFIVRAHFRENKLQNTKLSKYKIINFTVLFSAGEWRATSTQVERWMTQNGMEKGRRAHETKLGAWDHAELWRLVSLPSNEIGSNYILNNQLSEIQKIDISIYSHREVWYYTNIWRHWPTGSWIGPHRQHPRVSWRVWSITKTADFKIEILRFSKIHSPLSLTDYRSRCPV